VTFGPPQCFGARRIVLISPPWLRFWCYKIRIGKFSEKEKFFKFEGHELLFHEHLQFANTIWHGSYTDCQQRLLVAFQVSSCRFVSILCLPHTHRRSQGGQRDHGPSKYLENIVIVCLEKRFSKQNSLFRLKSNVLSPPKFLALPNSWAGYATAHAFFLRGPVLVLLIIKLCRHSTSLL